MTLGREWRPLSLFILGFLVCYFLPIGWARFHSPVLEGLHLIKWYAREHVILCLIPAFFIAGAIAVFVSKGSILRYLGPGANKAVAYGVASVSGSILAVCSCTVLPLFAGIYRRGAGLGPATAFLYAGPAINVLAIILTARVLGMELGIARAVGAILFSVVIGLLMHLIFRRDEQDQMESQIVLPEEDAHRPLWQTGIYFASMIAILVFANWGAPGKSLGFWQGVYSAKWLLTGLSSLILAAALVAWFGLRWRPTIPVAIAVAASALLFPQEPLIPFAVGILGISILANAHEGELLNWFDSSWGLAKQILPLLLVGVFVAGVLLGRPQHQGLIPPEWIHRAVGGNSIQANVLAAVAGAFMYFATLTEVPILEGLMGGGMGNGPALALLLAGPAVSLPNMLVIRSVIGLRKTLVFVLLVVVMATVSGIVYGALFD
jgi:uncharacterized membrane protein YraQ (UPF0718 family)